MLENLKLVCSEDTGYKMFLVDEDQMIEQFIFSVVKGYGLLVVFNAEVFNNGYVHNCFIRQAELAVVFCDFVENYVPERLAVTQAEMIAYLDYLIEPYR